MGSKRRSSRVDRCNRCRINIKLCFCKFLKLQSIATPVHILMHYKELKLTSNTSHFMNEVHPECYVHIRGRKDEFIDFKPILSNKDFTPIYLYPCDESIPLTKSFLSSLKKPPKLIVPDGSWRQAKKCKRRVPQLSSIQTVSIPGGIRSEYSLRNAPSEGMLSTFEAITAAIQIIEGKKVTEDLEKIFLIMVKQIETSRIGGSFPSLSYFQG